MDTLVAVCAIIGGVLLLALIPLIFSLLGLILTGVGYILYYAFMGVCIIIGVYALFCMLSGCF